MKTVILSLLLAYCFAFTSFRSKPSLYSYSLESDKSVVLWAGSSPRVTHDGSFSVVSEGLEVVEGQVKGGTFVIPIASIQNFDLSKTIRPVLLKHLKSEDFFHLALYPEATFTITQVEPLEETVEGAVEGANVLVTGDFTLIGNTHPISFPARVDFLGEELAVEAKFSFDRTKWGMNYAADPALKNRHIYPEVAIHLKAFGKKQQI
jgi:polyisoprenoid-binding protein YceI